MVSDFLLKVYTAVNHEKSSTMHKAYLWPSLPVGCTGPHRSQCILPRGTCARFLASGSNGSLLLLVASHTAHVADLSLSSMGCIPSVLATLAWLACPSRRCHRAIWGVTWVASWATSVRL